MSDKKEKLTTVFWCLCWGAASTAWCWTSMFATGATYDEFPLMRAGLHNWHHGYHRELLAQGAMPLAAEVQSLPLLLAEQIFGASPLDDFWTWLPIARLGTTLFWWLLLWSVYRLAAIHGGYAAGRWAVALVACEPVLLGHASLATSDLAFTACLLNLLAVFRRRRDAADWRRRLLVPTLAVTLTFLAKASALLFVPVCLAMVELERLLSLDWRPRWDREAWQTPLGSVRDLAFMGLVGTALLFVVCPRAWRALSFQIQHNAHGHGTVFLLGETSPTGFWYYFPATLLIKLGLPIFILLLFLVMAGPRRLLNGPMLAALGLLALSPTFRVQIGIRHVLAIAVLAMIAGAIALAQWQATQRAGLRRLASGFACGLILWTFTNAWLIWPHGICFTNPLSGGTSGGYLALWDSNYDWGQGLKDLAAWQDRHRGVPLKVCYFGCDPMATRLPLQQISMAEALRTESGGYLAVSTHFCAAGPLAQRLARRKPCDRTMTFLIYDLAADAGNIACDGTTNH